MKKASAVFAVFCMVLAVICTLGFYMYRNQSRTPLHIRTEATVRQTQTEPADRTSGTVPAGPVNINTAGLEELTSLPGIGPVLGQRIIDYREEHGPFENTAALLNVSGIGAAKLEAILDQITTGGSQ